MSYAAYEISNQASRAQDIIDELDSSALSSAELVALAQVYATLALVEVLGNR